MEAIEAWLADRRIRMICLIAIVGFALGGRLFLAAKVQHPGHADPAFYYTLANNIVEGRGLVIDYIWHYLGDVETISHAACDYWPPMTSIVISLFFSLFGQSLFSALLPMALSASLLALLTYAVARAYSSSALFALSAAALAAVSPDLFVYSLRTEATLIYALVVGGSLLCAVYGTSDARWQVPAFALAALAPPTRQDGFLLLPVVLAAVAISQGNRRSRARRALIGLACYALLLAPYLYLNMRTLGRLLPAGVAKTVFLTDYEDVYSYAKELSWRTYLAWGWRAIVRSKLLASLSHAKNIFGLMGATLSAFWLLSLLDAAALWRASDRWQRHLPPLLFLTLLYVSHAFIYTIPSTIGSFRRSLVSLTPFLVASAVRALERFGRSASRAVLVIAVAAGAYLWVGARESLKQIEVGARMKEHLIALRGVLVEDTRNISHHPDIVVMTRNPWEVFVTTGYQAIQIPNNDRETIYDVARRFRATYLLLPGHRPALDTLDSSEDNDPRFVFVAQVPGSSMKVYRIIPADSPQDQATQPG